MAANGVKDFFPFLTQTAASNSAISHFLNFILPDSPYIPTLHLKGLNSESIVINYPLVAVAAVAGFIVCLDGGRRLLRLTGTTHQFKGSFSWGMAMLSYALMCFGGFWYHSINHGQFFYKVDVTGTACSSLSIVAGSLGLDDRIPANRRIIGAMYLMATVGAFFGSQLTRELLYLLPTAAAFLAGFGFCVKTVAVEFGGESRSEEGKEKTRKAEIGWYVAVAVFGAGSGFMGLVFSRWIMEMIGPNFYPVFWFFFGCEVALWGLFRLVVSTNDVGFLVLK
ncbi:uncharacterized protein LOC126409971 [Nymphaea colorata]|uniref:uncharacterized protein LOC126409971 n=1 Tax=Nymphaea colorata TaxID=210225 RepID=UPI00214EA7C5|nr:uncharacterized protein LOC126409971 [Nymphaea colorata]